MRHLPIYSNMKKDDVVLYKFPFSNFVGYKKRPCVILSNEIKGDVLLCQITSVPQSKEVSFLIEKDFLTAVSYVNVAKISSAVVTQIDGIIGKITDAEYKEAVNMIYTLLK
jgi:mRNA-degrading endonuclease toxin of MazEF toxin-antitoxin module